MSAQFRFTKILAIKDSEKNQMLLEFKDAQSQFEAVLEKLYTYLKQKEDLEQQQKEMLAQSLSIQVIQQQEQWIKNLENIIIHYQTKVITMREKMQQKQAMLQEKNIEVKKYEMLKEKHTDLLFREIKANERKRMDEISIQQYMKRGN